MYEHKQRESVREREREREEESKGEIGREKKERKSVEKGGSQVQRFACT